jgi:putative transposase
MGRRGRSFNTTDTLFFVTSTVVNFAKVFTDEKYCKILIDNIKHYQQRFQFDILAYVIMPSHFHWIVDVKPELGTISGVMRDIKKYSAWQLMEALENDGKGPLLRLFRASAQGFADQSRRFWMKRFDDEVVRNAGMLRTKIEYIHYNPVKAGLISEPEQFKYSSARNYMLGDHSVIRVKTDW